MTDTARIFLLRCFIWLVCATLQFLPIYNQFKLIYFYRVYRYLGLFIDNNNIDKTQVEIIIRDFSIKSMFAILDKR